MYKYVGTGDAMAASVPCTNSIQLSGIFFFVPTTYSKKIKSFKQPLPLQLAYISAYCTFAWINTLHSVFVFFNFNFCKHELLKLMAKMHMLLIWSWTFHKEKQNTNRKKCHWNTFCVCHFLAYVQLFFFPQDIN